jgi:nucleoid-associated protein YgaU
MGQFEKIVVLIAFFLVSVILVVTFSSPEDAGLSLTMGTDGAFGQEFAAGGEDGRSSGDPREGEDRDGPRGTLAGEVTGPGSNPRRGTSGSDGPGAPQGGGEGDGTALGGQGLEELTRAERAAPAEPAGSSPSPARKGDLFLDDSFSARARQRGELPVGAALVTLEGLAPTFDSSIMEYTWRQGDNWVLIAERVYGDGEKSSLLRQFNEGTSARAPGETILVPVYDGREAQAVTERGLRAPATAEEHSLERGNLYRVEEGDSLWVISKKVYGKGSEWEKIYRANTDILSSPDDVKPGMGLRIP